jgi:hypothetical protein
MQLAYSSSSVVGRSTQSLDVMKKAKHEDGTPCPEGSRKVPRGFGACCEVFEGHTTSCYFDIRYEWWAKERTWVTVIPDGAGGGGIEMFFCPHCGTRLEGGSTRAKVGAKRKRS